MLCFTLKLYDTALNAWIVQAKSIKDKSRYNMSCNNVQNKLREQKGASLAMALFLLIVVTIVATIMINSAYSNAGRVRRNIKAEQNYLAVNSAAELVKSYLSGVTMKCVITETEGSDDDTANWKTYEAGKGDNDNGNKHIWIFQKNGTNYYVDVEGNSREQAYVKYRNNEVSITEITDDGDIQPAGTRKSASYQYGYFSWQKETYYYYTHYKELISSGSTEPTTTTELSFKDSVSNTEYTGTDYTKSGNPFAVKLMKWFENNRSAASKTEANEYTISVKGSDGNAADITDVKVVLSISGTDFKDASSDSYDNAATYIVASLSLADESSDTSGSNSSTGSDGTIKKNGNENYYMSITIPFTAVKDEQTTGSKSVSDPESGMELSSLYDEDDDSIDSFDADDIDYDDDIDAQDEAATTVTTYTVTTAAASGASNNVDVEKGELSLGSLNN